MRRFWVYPTIMLTLGFVIVCGFFFGRAAGISGANKLVWMPQQNWLFGDTLRFQWLLEDTSRNYGIFWVTHYSATVYPYKNLWLNARIDAENQEHRDFRINLQLADNNRGYLGSGMFNVYRNYSLWRTFRPKHSGLYAFSLSHLMPEDSLAGIYAMGMQILPLNNPKGP